MTQNKNGILGSLLSNFFAIILIAIILVFFSLGVGILRIYKGDLSKEIKYGSIAKIRDYRLHDDLNEIYFRMNKRKKGQGANYIYGDYFIHRFNLEEKEYSKEILGSRLKGEDISTYYGVFKVLGSRRLNGGRENE